jgi:hypothetical protein
MTVTLGAMRATDRETFMNLVKVGHSLPSLQDTARVASSLLG